MTTTLKDITNREDIAILVRTFYDRIRADDEINFYFNEMITDWEEHLEKLTDFWEMNLFGGKKYKADPLQAHVKVDAHFEGKIGPNEFGIWLNHWAQTLDELFEGENVEILKRRARKMGTFIYMAMFKSRS
ncbi:group III truncated hemoglobin [Flavobacterium algicola]|uniref:group III truncated hemoglobin n=1 Tax=Flavobacterium algicola TaxID=556529 RepID=UPI001EFDB2FF|nr:group III truncated hemoglobin [Flavobacterium algicola]MCG9791596.1 group III truncated hemoglobin [Flavobacterium algicola]